MAKSLIAHCTKTRLLAGVMAHVSEKQLETLEILADVDQVTQLMTSLLEARTGQVISLDNAFADL